MSSDLSALLILGALLTLGFLAGLAAEKFSLPRIVAYILVGISFSPGLLGGTLNFSTQPWAPLLTDICLGIIAYLVGSEIDFKSLKKDGRTVFSAVLGQSFGALIFITLGLWLLNQLLHVAPQLTITEFLIFGAVATATAPATTMGIIEEYEAKGALTNKLLGVIAIDDAIGIIFFTLILGMAGKDSISLSLLHGLREMGGALILGGILGFVLGILGKYIRQEDLRLPVIIGFVFIAFGISRHYDFSMLLTCMILGLVSELIYPKKQTEWLLPLKHIEELVFLFFFTLAGLKFKISVFTTSSALILAYIVLRSAGKYIGAYSGMALAGTEGKTRKLLGLCLFPQAGVAIGLAILASNQPGLQETGSLLLNVILGSTIIFEITSPLASRYALKKAGDIKT